MIVDMGRNWKEKKKKVKSPNTIGERRLSVALRHKETAFQGGKDIFATVFVTQLSGYVLGKEEAKTHFFFLCKAGRQD